ncbi:MAG TPA: hypothetical protein VE818_04160 [Nitrososphaeraceae archaeon]|jgi:hypothetical protein|nr:hypothetical protein [Nitrososphaeraceae archaeon]
MNIIDTEIPLSIMAKTCGHSKTSRRVTYAFVDSYHSLCIDKKDIIYSEIEACQRLLKYTKDKIDKRIIGTEIASLKMALDLMT